MKRVTQILLFILVAVFTSAIWFDVPITATSTQKAGNAAKNFKKSCASCHGEDGRAKTFKARFNGAKDLTTAEWQESVSDARIFNVISNGREKMPAFGKKFSQAQLEALVAFVRGLRR